MSYSFSFSPVFDKAIRKIKNKDIALFKRIRKKIIQITEKPELYKTLLYEHGKYKRVHVSSFIIRFTIKGNDVQFLSIKHHDDAY